MENNNVALVKKKKRASFKKDLGSWVLILPFIICLIINVWGPNFQGIFMSFFKMRGYNMDSFCGLENYTRVLSNTNFVTTLWNTLKYVWYSLIIGFWPPVVIAILMNELKYGKNFYKLAMYFPSMVPGVAVSMLWFYLYYPDVNGLLNQVFRMFSANPEAFQPLQWLQDKEHTIMYIVISSTWAGLGGSMLIYLAALQGVNAELYEAALLDGAGFLRRIWNITLPTIAGIVLINLVRQIIGVFQIMEQPLTMTDGGPNNASMSLGLLNYRYAFQYDQVGNSLALSVVMFLMLIVLTILYFFVKDKVDQDA